MVVVQVWDLSGQFPLGFQKVELQVLQKAQELAKVQGREKVTLQELELVQAQEKEWVQALERESALPLGYRLDSEQGLVRDLVQVTELELG